jgi:hypothetical protein
MTAMANRLTVHKTPTNRSSGTIREDLGWMLSIHDAPSFGSRLINSNTPKGISHKVVPDLSNNDHLVGACHVVDQDVHRNRGRPLVCDCGKHNTGSGDWVAQEEARLASETEDSSSSCNRDLGFAREKVQRREFLPCACLMVEAKKNAEQIVPTSIVLSKDADP